MAQVGGKPLSTSVDHVSRSAIPTALSQREPRWRRLRAGLTSRWTLSLLFCSLALVFNLYRLGMPSIWFDEAFSVELARQPLPLLWHIIFGPEPNMELYYLLLHGWLALTAILGLHPTEFVVRLPSALFAALSTVIVFQLGNRFAGRFVGSLAACLYLLNDLQLLYAQQARSYSLQLLLMCLAWYALFAATLEEARQRRWWVCFVLATTLAIYAQLFTLFLLLAQLITFALWLLLPNPWRRNALQQLPAALLSLCCIGILCLPLLVGGLQLPKTDWLPVPQFRDIALLLLTISGDNKIYAVLILMCCGMAMYGAFLVGADLPRPPPMYRPVPFADTSAVGAVNRPLRLNVPITIALLCWIVVPIVVSFVISLGPIHLFSSRYLVVVVPPLLLLTAMGLSALRWRTLRVMLTLGLCLLALQAVPLYYRSAQVEDWNVATFWLEQNYHSGDGLVCYDNAVEQGCQVSVEYYLNAYPSAAHFTSDAPGAFSWTSFGAAHPEAAVDPVVLASFGAKHARLFYIVGRLPDERAALLARQAQHWLDGHYHFVTQMVTRTVTVRLYMTE